MRKILCLLLALATSVANADSAAQASICAEENLLTQTQIDANSGLDQVFPDLRKSYPVLARIVTGRIRQRLRCSGSQWAKLNSEIQDCAISGGNIKVKTDKYAFRGGAEVIEKEGAKILQIRIDYFAASAAGDTSSKRTKISLRETAKGPNFQFVYLIGTVFSAIEEILEQEPDINRVRVVGSYVVNKVLAQSLSEMGFHSEEPKLLNGSRLRRLSYKTYPISFAHALGLQWGLNPTFVALKSLAVLGFKVWDANANDPHDFTLELPVASPGDARLPGN